MTIKPEYREGCLRLSFQGELDHHSAEKALREAEGIIDRYLPKNCILDLSGLSFMDSSGIAVILRIHRRMAETGGRLLVDRPADQARRVLDAAGLNRIVPIREIKETVQ